ncbi:hypothetical protein V3C99_001674 [Haemonchus contortus]|uniref:FMRFamide-related neuropeptides-like n=1 Tax=Haemonchus contortus TaxID=6289 RepID=A0A7I4YCN2_HAECO|nr:FMRFamide-related peptide domain containing protein [Haemonchus contortus]CDJ86472.1 FMRFamide-related peptide domain containing protein [Haemonchus contortus]
MHSTTFVLLFTVVACISYSYSQPCTTAGCEEAVADIGLPSEYRQKRHYDFVRFGRAAGPEKKASYDYIRFGKRSQIDSDDLNARFSPYQFL